MEDNAECVRRWPDRAAGSGARARPLAVSARGKETTHKKQTIALHTHQCCWPPADSLRAAAAKGKAGEERAVTAAKLQAGERTVRHATQPPGGAYHNGSRHSLSCSTPHAMHTTAASLAQNPHMRSNQCVQGCRHLLRAVEGAGWGWAVAGAGWDWAGGAALWRAARQRGRGCSGHHTQHALAACC